MEKQIVSFQVFIISLIYKLIFSVYQHQYLMSTESLVHLRQKRRYVLQHIFVVSTMICPLIDPQIVKDSQVIFAFCDVISHWKYVMTNFLPSFLYLNDKLKRTIKIQKLMSKKSYHLKHFLTGLSLLTITILC